MENSTPEEMQAHRAALAQYKIWDNDARDKRIAKWIGFAVLGLGVLFLLVQFVHWAWNF